MAAAALTLVTSAAACSSSSPTVSGTPGSGRATITAGSGAGFNLPVSHPTVWLCRPGMTSNPCVGNLDTTVVAPDGTRSTEVFRPAANPKIDCFYVYPTVSEAASINAPLGAPTQHACVVAYSMFDTVPPPDSLFGRPSSAARSRPSGHVPDGWQVLCVNPAALRGGPAPLHPYLPTRHLGGSAVLAGVPAAALPDYPTAFVSHPGQPQGTCHAERGVSWLQIDPVGQPVVPAPVLATLGPSWGLHLYDLNADQGDLIILAREEADAWR